MSNTFTVSNGLEFLQVSESELSSVAQNGFYRPTDRGLTIVSDGKQLFEIPIVELPTAVANGYRDVLAAERSDQNGSASVVASASNGASTPARLQRADESRLAQATVSTPGALDSVLLVDELTQAETEAEQAEIERSQQLEEAEGFGRFVLAFRMWLGERRLTLLDHFRGSGVSIVIHVAIFLMLASLALVNEKKPEGIFIAATPASQEVIDEVIIEPDPLEITEPNETEDSETQDEAEEMPPEMAEAIDAPNFLSNVDGNAVAAPAAPAPEPEKQMPVRKTSKVFGTQRSATNYVFVIDNSNSMGAGRFETALYELMVAIKALTPKQNFFVVFYSDTAYPMLHPKPAVRMVAATDANKNVLASWLNTVPLCLKTNGKEAIKLGFSLQPDVMYVLGDGAFTDQAGRVFSQMPRTKTIVHCRGMEVSAAKAKQFEALARAHGGNYKDVGVHDFAAAFAKKNPRPKNSIRNGYWGITLPAKRAKPKPKPNPKLKPNPNK